ncbi:MAG: hypothetical protein QOH53_925, partial [Ilumatobacteraceae bacterium]
APGQSVFLFDSTDSYVLVGGIARLPLPSVSGDHVCDADNPMGW